MEKLPKNPILFGILISKLYKKWTIAALFFVFFGTAFSRYNVVVLGKLTDSLTVTPIDINNVWPIAITYIAIFFVSENIWRSSGFTGMRWFMGFRFSGYQSLYEYLTLHSKDYFNSRFSGSLANKITHAVDGTQSLFEKTLWNFIPLVLGLFWFTGFSFYSDFRLGLIIAIWSIIFLTVNLLFAKKLHPHSFHSAKTGSILKGRIVDSLSNISLVHEYAYIAGERDYIKNFVQKDRDAGLALWKMSEWMLFANGTMICIFMCLMVGMSLYLFEQKIVTAGVVVMVIAIIIKLADQLLFLGMEICDGTRYFGEAKEGLEEILHDHAIVDRAGAIDFNFTKGSLAIESMDFEYENKKVFQDFSLTIPAGQKVGLIGRSGAGKTTLASILLRHFEVQKGEIRIDGENIYGVTLESLRRAIAFVPQDTSLFHRTIWDNIRYSNPKASNADVQQAAKLAQADEFIMALPSGYDTLVGERGVKLSGGQRQRIAIARAFLKDAPILLLDEATSSLDSQSEHAIQESLDVLMKKRTVIAIAHRLSTLKKMDRLVVLAGGQIVEDGKPAELMKKTDGIFKKMWDHQVQGFILDE